MRVLLPVFLFGALTVNDTTADDKQEPKEFKHGGYVFTERLASVKEWDKQQKKFLKPHENVWAFRKDTKEKGLMIAVYGTTKPGADLTKSPGVFKIYPEKGSVLVDSAGNEYEVTETEGSDPVTCWVKLTKAAKKP